MSSPKWTNMNQMNYSHMLSLTTQQSRTVPSARNKNKHISTSHTNLEEMSPLAVPKIFKSAPVKCTAFSTHLQLPARYPTLCLLASNPSKQSRWSYKATWQVHRAWRLIHNCHRFKSIFGSPQELLGRFKTAVDGWYVTDLFKSRTGILGSVKLQAWQGLEPRVNWPCGTVLAQPESLWIWQREWRIVRILSPRCAGQSARFFAARWMITPKEKYAENAWECRTTLSQHQDHRRTVHRVWRHLGRYKHNGTLCTQRLKCAGTDHVRAHGRAVALTFVHWRLPKKTWPKFILGKTCVKATPGTQIRISSWDVPGWICRSLHRQGWLKPTFRVRSACFFQVFLWSLGAFRSGTSRLEFAVCARAALLRRSGRAICWPCHVSLWFATWPQMRVWCRDWRAFCVAIPLKRMKLKAQARLNRRLAQLRSHGGTNFAETNSPGGQHSWQTVRQSPQLHSTWRFQTWDQLLLHSVFGHAVQLTCSSA